MVLEIERRGAAAWLWLNRPELRNALNGEVQEALARRLNELEADQSARVLVLAGRGQAFCAGGDLSRMERASRMTQAKAKAEAGRFAKL
ncbi:MAG: enoyl-CoA hydratase/isomerase family protein, partial [Betaproteobacteria bacterium]|nr:enoyl-CoA hydratase/isomerase family protein [Betaproteobacteria bacterium]